MISPTPSILPGLSLNPEYSNDTGNAPKINSNVLTYASPVTNLNMMRNMTVANSASAYGYGGLINTQQTQDVRMSHVNNAAATRNVAGSENRYG